MSKIITNLEAQEILGGGGNSLSPTRCLSKDLLINNFSGYDDSHIQEYANNQLLKIDDVKKGFDISSELYFSADFSSTLADSNGNLPAAINGTCTIDSTKQALLFSAGNERLTYNASKILDVTKGTTMTCWYYRTTSHNNVEYLNCIRTTNSSSWWANPFGLIPFNANGNATAYPLIFASARKTYSTNDLNRWVFLAGTTSPTHTTSSGGNAYNIKLYQDLNVIATANEANAGYAINYLTSTIYIGGLNGTQGFRGYIRNAKIWNRELSSEEILQVYNETMPQ